jgi:23S rRNA (guanosine2251-2'-O)-methyltransferase
MNKNNYIMGKNTLEEVLKYKPDIILKVFVNINEKPKERTDKLLTDLLIKKVPLKYLSKNALSNLVDSESHQSFVAEIKSRNYMDLKTFLKKDKDSSFVLMLDNISDPQNMGAIIRSSECFDTDAIVFSKNRGAEITPVVSKVSCGGSELLPLIRVSNLAQTAKDFQKNGYEVIVAENSEKSVSLFDFSFSEKTLLIMGSEGKGVQRLLKEIADSSVKIPLTGKINSLNVAQATAIFLSIMKFKTLN